MDTTYYKKYKERFVVTYFISARNYNITVNQKFTDDKQDVSPSNYFAEANTVSGFSFQYDIFALSIGFKSAIKPEDKASKGTTRYTDFGLTSIGNKISFEAKYRNYLGFYDKNKGGVYDTLTKSNLPYYQNSSMGVQNFKGKFYYFFNHKKFSFPSAYASAQKQLKGVGSWFLISNLYHLKLKSDTSFIAPIGRNFYGDYGKVNSFGVTALSAGGGGSRNFIWKNLFLNLTLGAGLEMQWRDYGYNYGNTTSNSRITLAIETRAALGYNAKNFYMSITSYNDYSLFTHSFYEINTNFTTGQFNIGYRFKVKKPKVMDWVQATRLYQLF